MYPVVSNFLRWWDDDSPSGMTLNVHWVMASEQWCWSCRLWWDMTCPRGTLMLAVVIYDSRDLAIWTMGVAYALAITACVILCVVLALGQGLSKQYALTMGFNVWWYLSKAPWERLWMICWSHCMFNAQLIHYLLKNPRCEIGTLVRLNFYGHAKLCEELAKPW